MEWIIALIVLMIMPLGMIFWWIPVCTENVVRIDLVTESHNHPGRWWRCYPFFSIC